MSDIDVAGLIASRDFIVVVNTYPGLPERPGGEFIRGRVNAYRDAGYSGAVVEINRANYAPVSESHAGLAVLRLHTSHTEEFVEKLASTKSKVLVHSPLPSLQQVFREQIPSSRLVYFYHGFEVRDYRRLPFNYTTQALATQRNYLDATNKERWAHAGQAFADHELSKVFVSKFLRDIAQADAKTTAVNAHIIPNFIDTSMYPARIRDACECKNILLLRPFTRRNYGNDIAIEALRILSTRAGFEELQITIRGFGEEFVSTVAPLQNLENVSIEDGYSSPGEMASMHDANGIFLCPSRFDTQCVSLGEAMASGMACVTNDVPGITEFVDDTCVVLARPDNPLDFANALWSLIENPDRIPSLSSAAAKRVRESCDMEHTIAREIELFVTN